jgi:lysozyme family protein
MINDIRFIKALENVLIYEGGYSNNPNDKGGETNKGIIQTVYNTYRTKKKLSIQSVKNISNDEIQEIYYNNYWLICKADKMPLQLSMLHFDTSVNAGPKQAALFLQRALKVTPDGAIGPKTIAAINALGPQEMQNILFIYMDNRINFYIDIVIKDNTQLVFLKGWLQRCRNLERSLFSV